jgi:hypothetical protein
VSRAFTDYTGVKYPLKKRSTRFLSRILAAVDRRGCGGTSAREECCPRDRQCRPSAAMQSDRTTAVARGRCAARWPRRQTEPAGAPVACRHRQKGSVLGEDSPIKQVTAATKNASFRCNTHRLPEHLAETPRRGGGGRPRPQTLPKDRGVCSTRRRLA